MSTKINLTNGKQIEVNQTFEEIESFTENVWRNGGNHALMKVDLTVNYTSGKKGYVNISQIVSVSK